MNRTDLLFNEIDLRKLINTLEKKIQREVYVWDKNKVLAASEPDLIEYLVQKFTLYPPHLLPDEISVENEGESEIDISGQVFYLCSDSDRPQYVPGSYVTIAIPFKGDANLLKYRASTFSVEPPCGSVEGSTVQISFQGTNLEANKIQIEINSFIDKLEKHLAWTKHDCEEWNNRVKDVAEKYIHARKRKLLDHADMVSSLGLPIKRRSNSDVTGIVPLVRRKRPIVLPPTPKDKFVPEPELPDEEYDFILTTIDHLSQNIEQNPNTFSRMKEEQIRDFILIILNSHYHGAATSETFNAQGKTDILIRHNGKNVFIAECKIWKGSHALIAAIDQILGYLTWRDTKAALIFFSKNANFTNVLSNVMSSVPKHSNYKRELCQVNDTHIRYLFRQKNDPERDLYLAVQVFNIPKNY